MCSSPGGILIPAGMIPTARIMTAFGYGSPQSIDLGQLVPCSRSPPGAGGPARWLGQRPRTGSNTWHSMPSIVTVCTSPRASARVWASSSRGTTMCCSSNNFPSAAARRQERPRPGDHLDRGHPAGLFGRRRPCRGCGRARRPASDPGPRRLRQRGHGIHRRSRTAPDRAAYRAGGPYEAGGSSMSEASLRIGRVQLVRLCGAGLEDEARLGAGRGSWVTWATAVSRLWI